MKKMFKVFSILMALVASISFTSCGGSGDEPQPLKSDNTQKTPLNVEPTPVEKTDLQKVQEALTGSKWELTNVKIIDINDITHFYAFRDQDDNGCNFNTFGDDPASQASENYISGMNYEFKADSKLTFVGNCGSSPNPDLVDYILTQKENSFMLKYNQGDTVKLEIVTPIASIYDSTIQVKRLTIKSKDQPYIKSITYTYNVTN
jgi:hypothetical protein